MKPYNLRTTVISPGAVATELPNSVSEPDIAESIHKFYDEIAILRTQPNNTTRENDMKITKNTLETRAGPSAWFTGAVYIDTVAAPSDRSRLSASSVHFTPGARTAWHTHPNGQTIYVTEGVGLAQRRGGPIEVIRPGDRVFFEPGEEHWHGAAPNRFMTHLAMQDVDDQGNAATWGDHVSDEEYGAAPKVEDL
jgi:quercetin dioxygenase-like cupin family protein